MEEEKGRGSEGGVDQEFFFFFSSSFPPFFSFWYDTYMH